MLSEDVRFQCLSYSKIGNEIRLRESRRALVTILDGKTKVSSDLNVGMPIDEFVRDAEILAVWANREEFAQKIARKNREEKRKA